MTNQFSDKISEILAFSREEASRLSCCSVAPEHLLLGMMRLRGSATNHVFQRLGLDRQSVKERLERLARSESSDVPVNTADILLTPQSNNILKLAVLEARFERSQQVGEEHLLLAIMHDAADNGAKQVLESNDVNYEAVQSLFHVTNGVGLPDEDYEEDEKKSGNSAAGQHAASTTATEEKPRSKTPMLDNFSTDLTHLALAGKLDRVVGREREMTRVMEILGRRKKNNPILIGEPGVGKSSIVEGLAQSIANRQCPPLLLGKRVLTLDLTGVVAGTKYRGQFEERIRQLIKELEGNDDVIVFIDEIHTLIGAGSAPGTMDAANILKPALARGVIQCIGATTLDEYRNSIEKDGALERRFQKVLVEQNTPEETLQILHNIKHHYEQHHHVHYTDEALAACVNLTERYICDRQQPDKAIDVMDEVGARLHLTDTRVPADIVEKEKQLQSVTEEKEQAVRAQNFEMAASRRDHEARLQQELETLRRQWQNDASSKPLEVTLPHVQEVVSIMTGIPVQRLAQAEGIRLKDMSGQLRSQVIAQDSAIDKMTKAILRNRVGLKDPNHPIGVFMFIGPTGVGKTYLAKKLAEFMFGSSDALIRIDMSEFTESFNVSRLVGAPPGYVGYEEGGQLTERVRRKPYSIVLLDEIEKAHSNVFNLLLQVLDEGRLTDGNGRFVDFRNTVIIMTSNAGTRQLKDFGRGVGFSAAGGSSFMLNEHDKEHARSIVQKALSKQFSPEFLNRMDEIITFEQLDLEAIKKIVDVELEALFRRMDALGYRVDISDEAKTFVAEHGYDVQYGARPLKRAIQTYIEDGIAQLIVNDELPTGSTISITKEEGKTELTLHKA